MKKWEKIILESKTPQEYVENSLRSGLAPSEKARLARLWMESTGFNKDAILYARNRNPYWKLKKMEGAGERTRRRLVLHDYSRGRPKAWNANMLEEFLNLNHKDASGKYLRKDWELANHFSTSIPSIQYLRRKYLRVRVLLGPRARKEKIVEYLGSSEVVLSRADLKKGR
ncbi:MAG: hypothetical protein NT061_08805 [Spirochaetes bacterium]|nr:hypothetical protein [Spirochaetota bacterium]